MDLLDTPIPLVQGILVSERSKKLSVVMKILLAPPVSRL